MTKGYIDRFTFVFSAQNRSDTPLFSHPIDIKRDDSFLFLNFTKPLKRVVMKKKSYIKDELCSVLLFGFVNQIYTFISLN
jgi:hypothetical protein